MFMWSFVYLQRDDMDHVWITAPFLEVYLFVMYAVAENSFNELINDEF